jgi:hypothetical protein
VGGLNGASIVLQHLWTTDIVDRSGLCSGQFQVKREDENNTDKGDREIDRGHREEQNEASGRESEEIISPASYFNSFVDRSSGDNRRHSLSAGSNTRQRQSTDDDGTQFFRRIVVSTLVREFNMPVSLSLLTMFPALMLPWRSQDVSGFLLIMLLLLLTLLLCMLTACEHPFHSLCAAGKDGRGHNIPT